VRAGLARNSATLIKILGEGEISRPLTVRADKVSAGAREKIEKAGGTVVIIEKEVPSEASEEAGA